MPVVLRVERTEPYGHLPFRHAVEVQDGNAPFFVLKILGLDRRLELFETVHGRGGIEFAAGHDPFARRIYVHAVG